MSCIQDTFLCSHIPRGHLASLLLGPRYVSNADNLEVAVGLELGSHICPDQAPGCPQPGFLNFGTRIKVALFPAHSQLPTGLERVS